MVMTSAYLISLMFGGGVDKSATLYHFSFHLSVFGFLSQKMNFGSSVMHIVVDPATDCCRYGGVEGTVEHLLMVHIVECGC